MAKHHLRKDTTCENCGHTVEVRFCTHCGQENIETRQTFGHLVRHFMEDLTHYESNVWKTVKYLLFRPAYLTKCYLAGKRMTYVPPVKLYIFISFIAFFLPGILPDFNAGHYDSAGKKYISIGKSLDESGREKLRHANNIVIDTNQGFYIGNPMLEKIKTEAEYDSLQNAIPVEKREGFVRRWISKRFLHFQNMPKQERKERFWEQLKHNFPKVLFFYMPIFAFLLWLFHGKKKWFYFDHAIFTLHFFSFILLIVTIFTIINNLIPWHLFMNQSYISIGLLIMGTLWAIQYFYRGHRKLYQEKFMVNWIKSTVILYLNILIFAILLGAFVMLTIFTIH